MLKMCLDNPLHLGSCSECEELENRVEAVEECCANNTESLTTKVDKEDGKGLTTNDFTTPDKLKLDGIEENAEANVQADWNQSDNAEDDYIKNKPTIPTKISDLTNDSSFIIAPSSPSTDDVLTYDGNNWVARPSGGVSPNLFVLETNLLVASTNIGADDHIYGTKTFNKPGYHALAIAGWNAPDAAFTLSRLRLTDIDSPSQGYVTVAYDVCNMRSFGSTSKVNVDILWLRV